MGASSSGEEDIATRHQKALAACKGYTDKFPQVPPISFEQLAAQRAAGVSLLVVDVRSDPEQRVSMVAGALSKEDFETTLNANQVQPNTVRTHAARHRQLDCCSGCSGTGSLLQCYWFTATLLCC